MKQIDLHPLAEVEFWEAVDWYDEQSNQLGKSFAKSFDEIISQISKRPKLFPIILAKKRKATLVGFPYSVFYEIYADNIVIIAVFHNSRNPTHWQER
jgi:toxin ParE1/3/4